MAYHRKRGGLFKKRQAQWIDPLCLFLRNGYSYDSIKPNGHAASGGQYRYDQKKGKNMEFNEKIQELRKQKGLTQEELAAILLVSRRAISKWESGRGYPNIDSLKAIAKFFGVTIDELLSGDELLTLAEEDTRQKENHFRDLVFGLLDCSVALFFFLPLFGQKTDTVLQEVSLLSLTEIASYLRFAYFTAVIGMITLGMAALALQQCSAAFWITHKSKVSLLFNAASVLLFIIGSQPYAAALLFIFLAIKALMLIKWR